MTASVVEIHALSPERLADFLAFFDGEAFSDNPAWSSCYCQCFYEDHSKVHWPGRTAVENRECAVQRIAQDARHVPGRGVHRAPHRRRWERLGRQRLAGFARPCAG